MRRRRSRWWRKPVAFRFERPLPEQTLTAGKPCQPGWKRPMYLSRFAEALRIGAGGLAAHRLRSGLSALGIVLGVGSVIVMLGVGEAARYQALKQLEDLGANTKIG